MTLRLLPQCNQQPFALFGKWNEHQQIIGNTTYRIFRCFVCHCVLKLLFCAELFLFRTQNLIINVEIVDLFDYSSIFTLVILIFGVNDELNFFGIINFKKIYFLKLFPKNCHKLVKYPKIQQNG